MSNNLDTFSYRQNDGKTLGERDIIFGPVNLATKLCANSTQPVVKLIPKRFALRKVSLMVTFRYNGQPTENAV